MNHSFNNFDKVKPPAISSLERALQFTRCGWHPTRCVVENEAAFELFITFAPRNAFFLISIYAKSQQEDISPEEIRRIIEEETRRL